MAVRSVVIKIIATGVIFFTPSISTTSANFKFPHLSDNFCYSQITLIKIGYPQTVSEILRHLEILRHIFCLFCQFLLISFTFSLLPFSFCYLCHLLDPLKCHLISFQKFHFLIYILSHSSELTTMHYISINLLY